MATFPSKVNFVTGDVLTATNMNDIGGAINLLDGAQYAAGKNKIINGDLAINQRSYTTAAANGAYTFDRWQASAGSSTTGTFTVTAQTFTPGAAPVAGYESANYVDLITAGQSAADTLSLYRQKIEDVRTFAGETVVMSFWAKAATGTPKIAISVTQNFGSGGSPSASAEAPAGSVTISTSWARYSITYAVPSISGKTIGTTANTSFLQLQFFVSAGSTYSVNSSNIGIQANTFSMWGIQAEEADTASPFQTATGTIQGELAACQRYYFRSTPSSSYGWLGSGIAQSATATSMAVTLPSTMRIVPTSVDFSTLSLVDSVTATAVTTCTIDSNVTSNNFGVVTASVASGLTQYRPYYLRQNATSAAYIGFSAEL